jgi:RNA polymerase sigma-70 factor (ECF subfamily)
MQNDRTFTEAFEAYSDELFRHAYMRLSDRERALDLTQECFARVWEYTQTKEVVEWRPFLYRTLRHLIIDEYRKKKAVSLEALAQSHEMEVEALMPADESNTLEAAIGRFEGVRVLQALERLPLNYREAIELRYVEGLTPREIADIVDESENVVSVRVHRALKKLKEVLEHEKSI